MIEFRNLPPNVILSISTIVSGLIGALLGSFGTYIAERRMESRNEEEKARRLRLALREELKRADFSEIDFFKRNREPRLDDFAVVSAVPINVFESNVNDIIVLSNEEVKYIVDVYGRIEVAKEISKSNMELGDDKDLTENMTMNSMLEDIEQKREKAIRTINKNL